jgi:hypothetical protein
MTLDWQELLTLQEHMSSPPMFSGVRVTRSLVLCVCFVNCCMSFFDIRILITPWYLQTLFDNESLYDKYQT